jgi:2-methylisocitrate lyase-like PEP mutase family enzyme
MKRMTTMMRELLAGDEILVEPIVFDALTAKIAERVGFKMVGIGGFALGASLSTTEPLLGLEDLVGVCRYITAAVNIPLKVDACAGFGEPLHVMRTIRQLEAAGVAAAFIEDQIFPKRVHYHKGVEHTIPAEDMVQKIRAAVAARRDPDFVFIARTDAMRTEGFDAVVHRCNLYLEAGADMVFVFPGNEAEARRLPQLIQGPVCINLSDGNRWGRPIPSVRECQDMGYKLVSYSSAAILSAAKAAKGLMESIKTTGYAGPDQAFFTAARKYVEDTIGLDEMYKIERETVGI